MLRSILAAAVVIAAMPVSAAAQSAAVSNDNIRMRITPYFALAPSVTRFESRFLVYESEAEFYDAEFELGSGYGGGLNIEFGVADPVFFYIDGAFVRRDDSQEYSELEGGTRREVGSNWLMTRAGLGVRLRDPDDLLQLRRVGGSLFIGPAFIRELPRTDPFRSQADGMNIFGLNFGLQADVPLWGSGLSLSAALEDNLVWWPNEELGRRNDSVYASVGLATQTTVSTGATHIVQFRFGLMFRY
jgi:hypothetical protein